MNNYVRMTRLLLFCSVSFLLACSVFRATRPEKATGPVYDILITGGMVYDGTGSAARKLDIGIQGKLITALGDLPGAQARRTIDASGLAVAPGFIDIHAHGNPETHPYLDNEVAQGITLVMLGNDGSSPGRDDLGGYLDHLDEQYLGANIGFFVGFGTLRTVANVETKPKPSERQLAMMKALAGEAMESGAFGLSTGLEYPPGKFASTEEIVEVARAVARHGGIYTSHLRSEDDDKITHAVEEIIRIGREAGIPVNISHIKIVFGQRAEAARQIIEMMGAARNEGIYITADIYPYLASHTTINLIMPDWAQPPNDFPEVVRTRRQELEQAIQANLDRRGGPQHVLITSGPFAGQDLEQIAGQLNKPAAAVVIDNIGQSGASAAFFSMFAPVMETFLLDPHIMICSDGSPTMLHPRGYGAFARVLAYYVRERQMLTLAEAIRKMTTLPAATLGLLPKGRGEIEEGCYADLLIFDPQRVRDRVTFSSPHEFPDGIPYVVINGKLAKDNGQLTHVGSGQVLRSTDAVPTTLR
jgi:N-acyl-D-amino-acid deacylase